MPTMTLLGIKSKIKVDCDLDEETFISDTELTNLVNDGIRDVESVILNLNEDYYLSKVALALVSGTSSYSMPTDIYADKIRMVQYDDGSTKYTIDRVRDLKELPYIDAGAYYKYLITNLSTGIKFNLYPTSRETSSTNVYIWYIRNAKELSLDADVCDIPAEFVNYVYWKVRLSVSQKERDGNGILAAQKMVDDLKASMIETLTDRVPDGDDKVLMDTSFYWDLE